MMKCVIDDTAAWLSELVPSVEGQKRWDVSVRHTSGQKYENGGENGGDRSGIVVVLRAHGFILSEYSGFFRNAFSAGSDTVDICEKKDGVSLAALQAILGAMHRQPIEIGWENVYHVLWAAHFLQVDQVTGDCCTFLKTSLTVEEVLRAWCFSFSNDFSGSDGVLAACWDFICKNFKRVSATKDFRDLTPSQLKGLLCRQSLLVKREVEVVDAVLAWLTAGWDERSQDARNVLDLVRWIRVNLADLADLESVQSFRAVKCDGEEQEAVKSEVLDMIEPPQQLSFQEKEPSKLVAFEHTTGNDRLWLVSEYDLDSGIWSCQNRPFLFELEDGEHIDIMFSFHGFVLAVVDKAQLTGGMKLHVFKDGAVRKIVKLAQPVAGTTADSVLEPLSPTFSAPFLCVVCIDSHSEATKKLLLYDLRHLLPDYGTDSVDIAANLPMYECIDIAEDTQAGNAVNAQAIYFQDEVYLVDGAPHNQVSVFDLGAKTWRLGPATTMPSCNPSAHMFVLDRVLYSVGGVWEAFVDVGNCRNFEYLDPRREKLYEVMNFECLDSQSEKVKGNKNSEHLDPRREKVNEKKNFEYLGVGPRDEEVNEGWVRGPDLVRGSFVNSHYIRDGRLFLVGLEPAQSDAGEVCRVVQSIDFSDFTAGWRDETPFFEGVKPTVAFVI